VTAGATRSRWLVAAALVVATLLAYTPVFDAGFVWDDDDYVTANATLRSTAGLRRIWTEPGAVPQYYPLTFTSLWLEFQLAGLDARVYHATNVLLHATSAVLVYLVLAGLGLPAAWLGAALFALHPVHVESVAWVAERKNVLSGVLYLAATLVYLPRLDGGGARWRLPAALGLFGAALLAKTVTCTWPVVMIVLAWWRLGRWPRQVAREMLPALALGGAAGVLTMWMERHHVGAVGADWNLTLPERLLVAGRVPWFYVRTLVLPVQLSFIYPRWTIDAAAAWQWAFPLCTAAALGLLLWQHRRLGTGALVAAVFFLVTLAPAAGFIPVYPMRYSFVADHFQYLASLGPLVVAAALLRRAGPLPAGAVVLLLAVLTHQRGHAFRDAETLWRDTIVKNPGASMPRLNLGLLLQQAGRLDEAIAEYRHALAAHPDEADLHDNLGVALAAQGHLDEAIGHWRRALALAPARAGTHGNLGNALAQQGDLGGAVAAYEAALRIEPTHADASNNLGNVLAMLGRADDAIARYQAALRYDPAFAQPHENLGRVYLALGRPADAERELRAALALAPTSVGTLQALARLLAGDGRLAEAQGLLGQAVALRPGDASLEHDLGGVLQSLGQTPAALAHLEAAVRLAPRDADFRNDLGVALATSGDAGGARAAFEEALRLAPGHPAAAANLRALGERSS
jgi:tetratricopeptide (TPR) repeat protein